MRWSPPDPLSPRSRRAVAAILFAAVATPPLPVRGDPETERPLPEPRAFLEEVRKRFRSDDYLLDQYTFTERHTEHHFDAKGRLKKEKREVYEVYPSAMSRQTYRKLVERDGRPVSARELAEQDREHERKAARAAKKHASAEERRRERAAEREAREREIVDQMFHVYEITIERREKIEGRDTILVTFRPRPHVKPTSKPGKIFQKFAGRAWVDEADHQVVRAEAELLDTFSYGLGVLARLYKGATASFQRRKINGEVWLPSEARFRGHARLLLLKGLRVDSRSEYSDYKKFVTATDTAIATEKSSE